MVHLDDFVMPCKLLLFCCCWLIPTFWLNQEDGILGLKMFGW